MGTPEVLFVSQVFSDNHVKQGDIVLKYALTCAVRGAILANKNSSIELFYRKISNKGRLTEMDWKVG
ncbi:MAG TPA: hypothetical protein VEL11_19210 [Candidatus Bathyarchaeia archaeon]|nr:hypothetical protein [Candidatus Bathyarchaeia archaeon]